MMVGRLEPARVASDLDRGRKASKMAEPDECVLTAVGCRPKSESNSSPDFRRCRSSSAEKCKRKKELFIVVTTIYSGIHSAAGPDSDCLHRIPARQSTRARDPSQYLFICSSLSNNPTRLLPRSLR